MSSLYTKTRLSDEKGYGIIAAAAIPQGTLIITEAPLFTLPSGSLRNLAGISSLDALNKQVLQSVKNLSKPQQQAFLALHNAHTGPGIHLPPFVGICSTNCFELGVNGTESGVFDDSSRFNHSCTPNAQHIWNFKRKEMESRATRDIALGEEITFSYLSTQLSFQPYRERQRILQQRYGFLCTCPGCTQPGATVNDRYRAEIKTLKEKIVLFISSNPARALRECKRVIDLLPLIGLEGDLAPSYYDAFQVAVAHGDLARASAFTKLNVKCHTMFEGGDSEHLTPEVMRLVDKPDGHRLCRAVSRKWSTTVKMRKEEGEGFEEWLWMRAEK